MNMLTHTHFTGDTGLTLHEHIRDEREVCYEAQHIMCVKHLCFTVAGGLEVGIASSENSQLGCPINTIKELCDGSVI